MTVDAGVWTGALAGVILLALVTNILMLSQIQTFWIDAATGLIILVLSLPLPLHRQ